MATGQSQTGHYCVVDSLNTIIIEDSSAIRFSLFDAKMHSLLTEERGQISILHIGGSHVQADMFSHQVRSHFDSLVPCCHASRGIIFPFETAKTNNPGNYKVSHQGIWVSSRNVRDIRLASLGVAGIAVTTTDTLATISVQLNPESEHHRWKWTRLTLMGYGDDRYVEPIILVGDTVLRAEHDSIQGTYTYAIPTPAEQFTLQVEQHDTITHPFTVQGFLPENDEPGFVYHAIGVNGASVPSYLSCEQFEQQLALLHPDMIIFAIGINDAVPENFSDSVFIAHYDSLIAKIETVVPDCAYIFITNNDSYRKIRSKKSSYYQVNTNGLIARRAFYELARKHQGGVWDMFSIMGGLKSMRQWEIAGLAKKDKIHFTRKGYTLLGDLFYSACIQSYNTRMMNKERQK